MFRCVGAFGFLFLAFGGTALGTTPLTFTKLPDIHNPNGTVSSSRYRLGHQWLRAGYGLRQSGSD